MIYFISTSDDKFIKIGYTKSNVQKRISALQTGNGIKIKEIFSIDGSLKQEKHIHSVLRDILKYMEVTIINEWYPRDNIIIEKFTYNVKSYGISYALRIMVSNDFDLFKGFSSIRVYEKYLKNTGMSNKQAKDEICKLKREYQILNEYRLKCKSISNIAQSGV